MTSSIENALSHWGMGQIHGDAGNSPPNGYCHAFRKAFRIDRMNLGQRLKTVVIGKSRDLSDKRLFHKVSLIALFAWVALGADGISSSCYGPEAAFVALQQHAFLSVFVALGSVLTILVICASYSQIIEAFPAGGGGYLVASKLLSPSAGVVAGCALLIDYVLTIAVSIASGADALFSFLPAHWHALKLPAAMTGVAVLTLLNLRGVKESVLVCMPIFAVFVLSHAFAIVYSLFTHFSDFGTVATATMRDVNAAQSEIGWFGMFLLVLRAYSQGAGTYTGIEAVSNALPMLREPRLETGRLTMRYMAISLAATVAGLLVSYLVWDVTPSEGLTLNAVLFKRMTVSWAEPTAISFVLVTLVSEAALLVIAAQAGFLGGPQVLANMALDRWFPTRFAALSDRFVTQNGVLLMGVAAGLVMFLSRGSVALLVVLYSINVFITFTLSQLGMVRHWRIEKASVPAWKKKLWINGLGFALTLFILVSLSIIKFNQGGWATLMVTGLLITVAFLINRHYRSTARVLRRLDDLIEAAELSGASVERDPHASPESQPQYDPRAKTAVVLVNGFNGLGLHTLLGIMRIFPGVFKNFVFVQVGIVDAGNFKGAAELENLNRHVEQEIQRYVKYMRQHGYYAEGITVIGTDLVGEVAELAPKIIERFPQAVFFGGQLVFPHETFVTRWLHNYAVFALQREFYQQGFPFLILPIRV
jgi:amino acid transporter